MNVKLENKVGARFKLITHKGDGIPVRETDWFHNMVLDSGLARMTVGGWIDRCCVGTGNSTPAPTQTTLDNFLASTTTTVANSEASVVNTVIEPYYFGAKITWRFSQGVASGNISEVGLGWGGINLWNRALIRDASGNPATITVLSDEYLDVVSEVNVYPPTGSGTFDLSDKNNNIISRHNYNYKPKISPGAWYAAKVQFGNTSNSSSDMLNMYSGPMGNSVTASPSSFMLSKKASQKSLTNGCQAILDLGLSEANHAHRSFLINIVGMMSLEGKLNGIQLEITPTITKLNSQLMTYTFELSWGRYEPA